MSPPDCGDNSCRYAAKKGGMRTNGGCRCDDCPACGGTVRPGRPVRHLGWCSQQWWIPDHLRATPRQAACEPPSHPAFDYDIYDCPCGHMYGEHEYHYIDRNMVIDRCSECDAAAATRNIAPEQNRPLADTDDVAGKSKAPGGKSSEAPGKSPGDRGTE